MRASTLFFLMMASAARADIARSPADKPTVKSPPTENRYDVTSEAGLDAALKAAVGLSSRDHCVERLPGEFSRVILVATFADDYGCYPYGYFADGVYVDSRTAAAKALASAGWSDPQKRTTLALAWVNAALNQTPLVEGTGDDAPRATLQKDGSVHVEGWQQLPMGMKPERKSRKIRAVFAATGDIRIETLKTKVEPGR